MTIVNLLASIANQQGFREMKGKSMTSLMGVLEGTIGAHVPNRLVSWTGSIPLSMLLKGLRLGKKVHRFDEPLWIDVGRPPFDD